MPVTYQIQVLQVDRPGWLADLHRAVAAELQAIGMHRSVGIDVTETITGPPTVPTVAAVLVGPASAADPGMNATLDVVLAAGTVAIPVLDDLGAFAAQAPTDLSPFNGFEWSGAEPERRLARVLLEELGIEDKDRRVFLSHKRSDGLGAAEQIHDALSHSRFQPFIDRFAIRPGDDVQGRIADALEQHAFLLILETPESHLSDWVYDEVGYALSHTMGTLIVQWPGDPTPIPGSVGIPRLTLIPADLTKDQHDYDILTDGALDRVLEAVETAHANGLVRRRRMLVCNVEEAAREVGAQCTPLKDWTLDITRPAGRSIVTVAPRLPTADDLQRLDEARQAVDPTADAVLVHATRHLRNEHRRHLTWVTGSRGLALLADNAIGAYW